MVRHRIVRRSCWPGSWRGFETARPGGVDPRTYFREAAIRTITEAGTVTLPKDLTCQNPDPRHTFPPGRQDGIGQGCTTFQLPGV